MDAALGNCDRVQLADSRSILQNHSVINYSPVGSPKACHLWQNIKQVSFALTMLRVGAGSFM